MKSTETLSQRNEARIQKFLQAFSRGNEEVRSELSRILASYNKLLSLNAVSFEELALHRIAQCRGGTPDGPLFNPERIIPDCPKCREYDRVLKVKGKEYIENPIIRRYIEDSKCT